MVILIFSSTVLIAVSHFLASANDFHHTMIIAILALPIHTRILVVLENKLSRRCRLFNHYEIQLWVNRRGCSVQIFEFLFHIDIELLSGETDTRVSLYLILCI